MYGIKIFSKILHFDIFCFLWSIWISEIFFKFWWLVLNLWLTKVLGYFQQKLILAGRATLTQIIFRSQHRHTCFLLKYLSWIYITKMKNMCTCWLLTLAMPKKTKFSKLTLLWTHNYLEKPTSAHKSFWVFWLSIT